MSDPANKCVCPNCLGARRDAEEAAKAKATLPQTVEDAERRIGELGLEAERLEAEEKELDKESLPIRERYGVLFTRKRAVQGELDAVANCLLELLKKRHRS